MKFGRLLITGCLALAAHQVKSESEPDSASIQHDPFQKPELNKTIINAVSPTGHEALVAWAPKLIMTLRAGRNSMANVNGKIIRLNENIEGYRLIEVHERSAVFVKQGKLTRLTLDDNNDE